MADGGYNGWDMSNGRVTLNGNLVTYYDFDRDADAFFISSVSGGGQKGFREKADVYQYLTENLNLSKYAKGGMMAKGGYIVKDRVQGSQGDYEILLTYNGKTQLSNLTINDIDNPKLSTTWENIPYSVVDSFAEKFKELIEEEEDSYYEDDFTENDWSYNNKIMSYNTGDTKFGAMKNSDGFTFYINDKTMSFESESLMQSISNAFIELIDEVGESGYDDEEDYAKGGKIKLGDTIYKAWFKNPADSSEKFYKVYVNAKSKVEAENKAKLIDGENFVHVSTPQTIFGEYQIRDIKSDSTPIYAKGGAINPNIILSFSFNTDNISLNEVKRIVEGYSKDWRTSGDISQVNFYVTLKENDADDLLKELKSYGYFYDFEKTKNRYAKGGMMSNGGILNEETKYKIDNGFTKKSFNEILNELFPYNFGFKVFKPLNRQNILTPNYDEAPSVLYGYDDSQIKSKLHFDQYKRDHAINFAIEQGGENTYYYFLIADQEGNEYVGTFGFKDQGDVDSSYVTRFIAFLMECYGLPFEVKHSVMAKGGYMAKGGISKDFSGNYYSTNDFVQQNGLEEEAVKVFGEDWEAEDDVDQIAELANHMGLKYVIKYAETRNQWNKLRQIDTYHKTPDSEYDIFVISNENWKKYLNK
jgi:hypothetical protein